MNRKYTTLLKTMDRTAPPAILIAASECAPLSKTGGLADVAGTLPKVLGKLGFDARVIVPYHACTKEQYFGQTEHLTDFTVNLGWRQQYAGIEKLVLDQTTYYLVDSEYYFGDRIYRGGDAEIEQYAFFCRAVLDAIPQLDFQPEILHCNDWQCAILPLLLQSQYAGKPQSKLKTLLTIHNMAFQGTTDFGLLRSLLDIDPAYMTIDGLEYYGAANQMKAGILFADRVNTVSPPMQRKSGPRNSAADWTAFWTHSPKSSPASSTVWITRSIILGPTALWNADTLWANAAAKQNARLRCAGIWVWKSRRIPRFSPWSPA